MSCCYFQLLHPNDRRFCTSALNIATVDATLACLDLTNKYARQRTSSTRILDKQPSLEKYYSMCGSSETFLSCQSQPFPSQGSLAGLEELAAKGSMAADGSLSSVHGMGLYGVLGRNDPCYGRMNARSFGREISTDTEHDSWADCLEEVQEDEFKENLGDYSDEPKHRRSRFAQVNKQDCFSIGEILCQVIFSTVLSWFKVIENKY